MWVHWREGPDLLVGRDELLRVQDFVFQRAEHLRYLIDHLQRWHVQENTALSLLDVETPMHPVFVCVNPFLRGLDDMRQVRQ